MARRYELEDHEWELIAPLLPVQGRGGRWADHRTVLNGMFWILRSGSSWRDMPERYGKWQTVYDRFTRWTRDGTIDRICKALRVRLDKQGKIDWDLWCVDGTSIRANKAAAGGGKKGAKASPRTTAWAARAADGDRSSTWLLTVVEPPSRSSSRRGRRTNPGPSRP
jgi:transposase